MGDALARVSLGAQERDQRQLGDRDDDHERRQRTERMDVVGEPETPATLERCTETEPLDHRSRDGQTEEREPGESGKDEDAHEKRDRGEYENAAREGRPRRPRVEHERACAQERHGDQRCERKEDHRLRGAAAAE